MNNQLHHSPSDSLPIKRDMKVATNLSILIAIVMTAVSLGGLLVPSAIYPTDELATTFVPNARGESGYSIAWWTHQYELKSGKRLNMSYAHGWGGQYIMVLPELNAVIVFTGANYQTAAPYFPILERYIIPSIT